jgi:2-keto-4-pentenoate hydratase/2-oxohepta-3-ene-1,7-dioic acid hydratase in catechol pathway
MNYVAGYLIHNDISERTFQLERSGQWVKGKSADTFAPLGPFMATSDEIDNPNNLDLWLKVNGEMLQQSNTSDMIFNIAQILSSISHYMTLLPGDIISTGTPSGVGLGLKPPRYLQPSDMMELGIQGLGVAKQLVVGLR